MNGAIELWITGESFSIICWKSTTLKANFSFLICFIIFSQIDRDVVGFAISYFDRYLILSYQKSSSFVDEKSLIKLVGMSSLYLAVKLHGSRKLSAASVAR